VQTDTLAQITVPWKYDFPLRIKRSKRCLCDTVPKDVAYLISFQTKNCLRIQPVIKNMLLPNTKEYCPKKSVGMFHEKLRETSD